MNQNELILIKYHSKKNFDYEKKQPKEKMPQKKPSLSSSRKFIKDLRLEQAHKASIRNREQIERSKQCGCFFCRHIFPASEVTNYVSHGSPPPSARTATPMPPAILSPRRF